jgi:hypothetical protein
LGCTAVVMIGQTIHERIVKDNLSHAILLTGPPGSGKFKVALAAAQELLCEAAGVKPCGLCGSCRRVERRESESLLCIEPQNGVIKIDPIRVLRERLSKQTWSRHFVVIIQDAHCLNSQAANALLKSLEEPPPGTHFFLVSAKEQALLSTIRSRCQVMRLSGAHLPWPPLMNAESDLGPLSEELWAEFMRGNGPADFSPWREVFRDKERALEAISIWSEIIHSLRRELNEQRLLLDLVWKALISLKMELESQVDRTLALDCFFHSVAAMFRRRA